jgi:hypothetical protein
MDATFAGGERAGTGFDRRSLKRPRRPFLLREQRLDFPPQLNITAPSRIEVRRASRAFDPECRNHDLLDLQAVLRSGS